jgi:hypothetical protein
MGNFLGLPTHWKTAASIQGYRGQPTVTAIHGNAVLPADSSGEPPSEGVKRAEITRNDHLTNKRARRKVRTGSIAVSNLLVCNNCL